MVYLKLTLLFTICPTKPDKAKNKTTKIDNKSQKI